MKINPKTIGYIRNHHFEMDIPIYEKESLDLLLKTNDTSTMIKAAKCFMPSVELQNAAKTILEQNGFSMREYYDKKGNGYDYMFIDRTGYYYKGIKTAGGAKISSAITDNKNFIELNVLQFFEEIAKKEPKTANFTSSSGDAVILYEDGRVKYGCTEVAAADVDTIINARNRLLRR